MSEIILEQQFAILFKVVFQMKKDNKISQQQKSDLKQIIIKNENKFVEITFVKQKISQIPLESSLLQKIQQLQQQQQQQQITEEEQQNDKQSCISFPKVSNLDTANNLDQDNCIQNRNKKQYLLSKSSSDSNSDSDSDSDSYDTQNQAFSELETKVIRLGSLQVYKTTSNNSYFKSSEASIENLTTNHSSKQHVYSSFSPKKRSADVNVKTQTQNLDKDQMDILKQLSQLQTKKKQSIVRSGRHSRLSIVLNPSNNNVIKSRTYTQIINQV